MEITVNKPLAETFGWLQAGAKRIDLQDKIQNISYVLGPGESRVLFLEDPGASEYEITLGEGARLDLVQLREASGKDLSYNNVRVTCFWLVQSCTGRRGELRQLLCDTGRQRKLLRGQCLLPP